MHAVQIRRGTYSSGLFDIIVIVEQLLRMTKWVLGRPIYRSHWVPGLAKVDAGASIPIYLWRQCAKDNFFIGGGNLFLLKVMQNCNI